MGSDPDPWCQEADGSYEPPAKGEEIEVEIWDRWNDQSNADKED